MLAEGSGNHRPPITSSTYIHMYIDYLKPINLEPGRWAERVCFEWFLWSAVSAFGDDCPNEGCTGVLLELLRLKAFQLGLAAWKKEW